MVDTVLKINLFFPSKLLQYQNQCVSVQLIYPVFFKSLRQLKMLLLRRFWSSLAMIFHAKNSFKAALKNLCIYNEL